ncbi:MAG TPA: isoprenylcysteine carboxylmethyltransferase family protein [Candidatus Krumholzibacteria bacterium]|nr:isoprenylcysteine carboxylmethyltransferase family protein [Candidatus Krumholzibacteria bacterium]
MPTIFSLGLKLCWLAVGAYWLWSARRVKAPERTESRARRFLVYWLPFGVAFNLLGPGKWFGHSLLRENFVPHTTPVYACGLALCALGAALAIWSRHLLGSNWSGTVQLKRDHELIVAGPYRSVRHPIYSGLLLLFLGNTLMVGDWRGLLAVTIVFASFWIKLRREEQWLTQRFGEAYVDYRRHTKALVPAVL